VKQKHVLVTGATGFLGSRLVSTLAGRGYRVRALSRRPAAADTFRGTAVEPFSADVADKASLRPAFDGIDIVVHAAADTSGSKEGAKSSTIEGTRNVVDLCEEVGVNKLIHISSMSVYGVSDLRENSTVTEDAPLERYPEKRGHYTWGKVESEKLMLAAITRGTIPIVCLRPGTIFGPGGEIFTPMMGFSLGKKVFAIIGSGDFVLPLVYIDNLVDAIIQAIEKDESKGQVFNVVDPDNPSKKEYVENLLKKLYPEAWYFYLPYSLLYTAVWCQEILFGMLRRVPFLTRYRLTSSQKNIRYDPGKIKTVLAWKPAYTINEAFETVIQYEKCRQG